MERLTERLTDKSYCISDIRAIQKETFYEDMECGRGFDLYTGKAIDKLAEYEDLEEQKKLLKPPVAPGNMTYRIHKTFGIADAIVERIEIDRDGSWVITSAGVYSFDDFGKTVFLTIEEAEDKLAEMEGKK